MDRILIIGNGRLARHLRGYFDFIDLPHASWHRAESEAVLAERAQSASHIIVAISDPAIEPFLAEHRSVLSHATLVHCSGSVVTHLAASAHPLMTFRDELYDLETYRSMPFILERGRQNGLADLIPGLDNPWHCLDAADKPLYHALCVLSGNFTTMLWEKAFEEFRGRLGLPPSALVPYLQRIVANLAEARPGESVLSGPIARQDRETIARHLAVLEGDPYQAVYSAFARAGLDHP